MERSMIFGFGAWTKMDLERREAKLREELASIPITAFLPLDMAALARFADTSKTPTLDDIELIEKRVNRYRDPDGDY